ncbi:hypothetical protein LTR08_002738 [Meristemomyces frigidus]|nr:hypothetical protein LTR08_002738 [Meristemomyces frigidus]
MAAGATGLNAAVESAVVRLSWRYLPVVLASSLIMLGWALIINNLGRRRYPMHWWAPGVCFVREPDTEPEEAKQEAVNDARVRREIREEGMLRRESIESSASALEAEEPEGRADEGDMNDEPADLDAVQTVETPEM